MSKSKTVILKCLQITDSFQIMFHAYRREEREDWNRESERNMEEKGRRVRTDGEGKVMRKERKIGCRGERGKWREVRWKERGSRGVGWGK